MNNTDLPPIDDFDQDETIPVSAETENAATLPEADDIVSLENEAESALEDEVEIEEEQTGNIDVGMEQDQVQSDKSELEESEIVSEAEASDDEIDDTIKSLIAELVEARSARDEAQDQVLRVQAELQNFRRRKERDTAERISQANASLLKELLPVIDDFELAFGNVPEDVSEEDAVWVEGFQLILRKMNSVLEKSGVTPIDTSGAFDPNFHEAISVEPSEFVESGDIIAEVRKGYMLNNRVLRASFVRVAI